MRMSGADHQRTGFDAAFLCDKFLRGLYYVCRDSNQVIGDNRSSLAAALKHHGFCIEIALDRLMREGRKFGITTNCTSQSIKDFGRDFVTIRQNTPTKIFMNNSDREIDYAADFLGDGRQITRLMPGTGIFYNSSWGSIKVRVRPPFSKVWDLSEKDTMEILGNKIDPHNILSQKAQSLLVIIEDHYNNTNQPLNITQLSQIAAITSKYWIGILL